MRTALEIASLWLFIFITAAPALYGLHMYLLIALAHWRRPKVHAEHARIIEEYRAKITEWPIVTTQIPLYNERLVAERVIEAVAAMDYPAGRHEIQVLDDSTDETREIVDRVAARLALQGVDIHVVRRPSREHFKAGALTHGLTQARGEFVAIFDADFVPRRGFLRNMVPLLASRPDAACVQGRWSHLNASETWLTRALSLGLDGHFAVEQAGRGWNGLFINFNGTGGVWRRSAIEDPRVGGWAGDTITEDFDLSYRAQLAGWKMIFHPDEDCPSEIPANVDAVKGQQRRWATGSIQCARKLLPRIWRAPLPIAVKLEASLHLTQYSISIFMVLFALFGRGLLWMAPVEQSAAWLSASWMVLLAAGAGPSLAFMYAGRVLTGATPGPLRVLSILMMGMGLCINNTYGIVVGLFQRGGEFVRTPKSGGAGAAPGATYRAIRSRLWMAEVGLGLFCLAQWIWLLSLGHVVGGLFLLLYAFGLLALGWQSRPRVSGVQPANVDSPVREPRPTSARHAAPMPEVGEPVAVRS